MGNNSPYYITISVRFGVSKVLIFNLFFVFMAVEGRESLWAIGSCLEHLKKRPTQCVFGVNVLHYQLFIKKINMKLSIKQRFFLVVISGKH